MSRTLRPRRFAAACAGAVMVFAFAACGANPPEAVAEQANALPGRVETAREANDAARVDFATLLEQSEYTFMRAYTPEEQHADRFDIAATKLDEAQEAYDTTVKPLVDNYQEEQLAELEAAIATTSSLIDEAIEFTADPAKWVERVAATKDDPETTVRSAAAMLEVIQEDHDSLAEDVATAREVYSQNAAAIDTRYSPVASLYTEALTANGLLQTEAGKSAPNYAVMTTHYDTVADRTAAFQEDAPVFATQLARLDVRETHTLVDIRVDSTVEVSRTSWDDSRDSPTEHDYDYPEVSVDLETADYFAQFGPDDVTATISPGFWNGTSDISLENVDQAQWEKLSIDPEAEWPDDDSAAEFYVTVYDTYCHKLYVMKNGEPDASGRPDPADSYCSRYDTPEDLEQGTYWVEADYLDAEAIGMDIYAKGWGDFEDQAATEASPPGIVYVGDPATGEWREDNHGNSFWHYYGMYAFFSQLIGGPNAHHYRSEWNTWNRDHRYQGTPFYSTDGNRPRYGMNSPLAASRFPNSAYVTSGLHDASIRGAGPAARAGGPGGGGK